MKNWLIVALGMATSALAQDAGAEASTEAQQASAPADDAAATDTKPTDAPPPDAVAAAPQSQNDLTEGDDTGLPQQAVTARGPTQGRPLVVRRGLFTDTNLGTFFTLGGNDSYSNAQSYVQLGLGYDLFQMFELGAHVGFGSNAFNCFAGRIGQAGPCNQSDAFTVTFFDASVAYLYPLSDRLYLTPKVVGGWTLLDPAPIAGRTKGVNVGAGVGIEYATSMDHFTIGADVLGRYILGANIPTVAIYPRVKYTF